MSKQFENERALQRQIEEALTASLPSVDVLDVELDAPREVVRLFIDEPAGVTHELCARVTSLVRETCPQYSLEVSSPGIERPLRRREHFERVAGSQVRLRPRGSKRPFIATVLEAGEQGISVRREDQTEQVIGYDELVRSRTVPTSDKPVAKKQSPDPSSRAEGRS